MSRTLTTYTFLILSERNIASELLVSNLANITIEREAIKALMDRKTANAVSELNTFRTSLTKADVEVMELAFDSYRKAQDEADEIEARYRELCDEEQAKIKELEAYNLETKEIRDGLVQIASGHDWDAAESLRTQFNEGTLHA